MAFSRGMRFASPTSMSDVSTIDTDELYARNERFDTPGPDRFYFDLPVVMDTEEHRPELPAKATTESKPADHRYDVAASESEVTLQEAETGQDRGQRPPDEVPADAESQGVLSVDRFTERLALWTRRCATAIPNNFEVSSSSVRVPVGLRNRSGSFNSGVCVKSGVTNGADANKLPAAITTSVHDHIPGKQLAAVATTQLSFNDDAQKQPRRASIVVSVASYNAPAVVRQQPATVARQPQLTVTVRPMKTAQNQSKDDPQAPNPTPLPPRPRHRLSFDRPQKQGLPPPAPTITSHCRSDSLSLEKNRLHVTPQELLSARQSLKSDNRDGKGARFLQRNSMTDGRIDQLLVLERRVVDARRPASSISPPTQSSAPLLVRSESYVKLKTAEAAGKKSEEARSHPISLQSQRQSDPYLPSRTSHETSADIARIPSKRPANQELPATFQSQVCFKTKSEHGPETGSRLRMLVYAEAPSKPDAKVDPAPVPVPRVPQPHANDEQRHVAQKSISIRPPLPQRQKREQTATVDVKVSERNDVQSQTKVGLALEPAVQTALPPNFTYQPANCYQFPPHQSVKSKNTVSSALHSQYLFQPLAENPIARLIGAVDDRNPFNPVCRNEEVTFCRNEEGSVRYMPTQGEKKEPERSPTPRGSRNSPHYIAYPLTVVPQQSTPLQLVPQPTAWLLPDRRASDRLETLVSRPCVPRVPLSRLMTPPVCPSVKDSRETERDEKHLTLSSNRATRVVSDTGAETLRRIDPAEHYALQLVPSANSLSHGAATKLAWRSAVAEATTGAVPAETWPDFIFAPVSADAIIRDAPIEISQPTVDGRWHGNCNDVAPTTAPVPTRVPEAVTTGQTESWLRSVRIDSESPIITKFTNEDEETRMGKKAALNNANRPKFLDLSTSMVDRFASCSPQVECGLSGRPPSGDHKKVLPAKAAASNSTNAHSRLPPLPPATDAARRERERDKDKSSSSSSSSMSLSLLRPSTSLDRVSKFTANSIAIGKLSPVAHDQHQNQNQNQTSTTGGSGCGGSSFRMQTQPCRLPNSGNFSKSLALGIQLSQSDSREPGVASYDSEGMQLQREQQSLHEAIGRCFDAENIGQINRFARLLESLKRLHSTTFADHSSFYKRGDTDYVNSQSIESIRSASASQCNSQSHVGLSTSASADFSRLSKPQNPDFMNDSEKAWHSALNGISVRETALI